MSGISANGPKKIGQKKNDRSILQISPHSHRFRGHYL